MQIVTYRSLAHVAHDGTRDPRETGKSRLFLFLEKTKFDGRHFESQVDPSVVVVINHIV